MTTRTTYPTDLTDAEWAILEPLAPAPKPGGRPAVHSRRAILNAIFYHLRAGSAWELLPNDFPPYKTVYHYFRLWRQDGTWDRLNAALRTQLRTTLGRHPDPGAAIVDSQSVKTVEKGGPTALTPARR